MSSDNLSELCQIVYKTHRFITFLLLRVLRPNCCDQPSQGGDFKIKSATLAVWVRSCLNWLRRIGTAVLGWFLQFSINCENGRLANQEGFYTL